MVRNGSLTSEEAARSPRRNALLRALGAAELVEPLVFREGLPLRDADRFVLCSDGLTDVVDDEAIRNIVALLAPSEACKELVGAALAAGGPDNISVGVFAVDAMMSI
jgi:protein phosphatase